MSPLKVKNIIFHQLIKSDEYRINLVLRKSELNINHAVENLLSEIHRTYDKKNKAYGLFNENSLFRENLEDHLSGSTSFLDFTSGSVKQLKDEMVKYPFSTGGTVVFCLYTYLTVDYLLITVLQSHESMLIDDNLDIAITQQLDISNADIVAQINLTEMKMEPNSIRYISFLKGRVGRKIADFFMDYLGAHEGLDTKMQNRSLVLAVNDYCNEVKMDKKEKQEVCHHVYVHCNSQLEIGEEVKIKNLSQEIPTGSKEVNFIEFINKGDYGLHEQFPVDKSTLKSLRKFNGSGGGLTISFDIDLLGSRILWDAQTDTLSIKGIPPNLRDQLQRNL